jgi:hypothetical protein
MPPNLLHWAVGCLIPIIISLGGWAWKIQNDVTIEQVKLEDTRGDVVQLSKKMDDINIELRQIEILDQKIIDQLALKSNSK